MENPRNLEDWRWGVVPRHTLCKPFSLSDDRNRRWTELTKRSYKMKRLILSVVAVLALSLIGAASATAQGFGHGGCYGNAGGLGYSAGYGGYGGGYGGYSAYSGIGAYSSGYGIGAYGGGYGGFGGNPSWHNTSHLDYHPAQIQRHGLHLHYTPGHYDSHRSGHWHR